jgi:microcystin-dependent protein
MTAPLPAAAGSVTLPGYTFNGAPHTGFYLAGANQIGWTANGVQGATFNADTSITFAGTVSAAKGTIPIGVVVDFSGSSAPSGWLLCFGQLVSTTTYAALFAALGTTYGSGAGTFGIPDYRGRTAFGQDNMGGSTAGRISIAGQTIDGTILGNTGGSQDQTLTLAQLPTGITCTGNISVTSNNAHNWLFGGSNVLFSGGGISYVAQSTNTGDVVSSGSNTLTSNNTSGNFHPILNPAIITNKIIYAGI